MTTKAHYDTHLAAFYSWMVGDFDTAQAQAADYFKRQKLYPRSTGLALDLGAGTGVQSVALARLGFRVHAVDFSPALLSELRAHALGLPVAAHEGDLRHFEQYLRGELPELLVCMGDTLTHLSSLEDVAALLAAGYRASAPAGRLVLAFRPLVQELEDTQRFLPVRSDANRIHTCLLEYFPERVRVTDLLHERGVDGNWHQKVSSYYKLRLAVTQVAELLAAAGWQLVRQDEQRGLVHLLAACPS